MDCVGPGYDSVVLGTRGNWERSLWLELNNFESLGGEWRESSRESSVEQEMDTQDR